MNSSPENQPGQWYPQQGNMPNQPPYIPQQPPHGWSPGMPPYTPPKQSKKWIFITLGIIAAVIVSLFVAVYSFGNFLASTERKTIDKIESIASRVVPEPDWVENYQMNPKVDPTCIRSNIACHRLERSWNVESPGSLSKIQDQLGIELKASYSGNCYRGEEDNINVKLCITDGENPQVNLWVND